MEVAANNSCVVVAFEIQLEMTLALWILFLYLRHNYFFGSDFEKEIRFEVVDDDAAEVVLVLELGLVAAFEIVPRKKKIF